MRKHKYRMVPFNLTFVNEPFGSNTFDPLIFDKIHFGDNEYRCLILHNNDQTFKLYRTADFSTFTLLDADWHSEIEVSGETTFQDHFVRSDGTFVLYQNDGDDTTTAVWTGPDLENITRLGQVLNNEGDCGVYYDAETETVHIYTEDADNPFGSVSASVLSHWTTPAFDLLNATQQANAVDLGDRGTGDPDVIKLGDKYFLFCDNTDAHPNYNVACYQSDDLTNWTKNRLRILPIKGGDLDLVKTSDTQWIGMTEYSDSDESGVGLFTIDVLTPDTTALYVEITAPEPSETHEEFTFEFDLENMPQTWWDQVDTTDGSKGRVADDDGNYFAADWPNFDPSNQTGRLYFFLGEWSEAKTFKIYPPQAALDSIDPDSLIGSKWAYSSYIQGVWPLATDANDRSYKEKNGTGANSITLGGVTGQIDEATDFDDSSDQYIDLGSNPSIAAGSNPRTLIAWVYPDTATGFFYFFCAGNDGVAGRSWRLATTDLTARIELQGSGYTSSLSLNLNSWNFVAVTFDGTTLADNRLYVNGTAEQASGGNSVNTANDYLRIGARETASIAAWAGRIQNVQYYSATKSDAWLDDVYAMGLDNQSFWSTPAIGFTGSGTVDLSGAASFVGGFVYTSSGGIGLSGTATNAFTIFFPFASTRTLIKIT
ncbi:LamG-like jellyroll fold domain-containing protein [Aeoliella sp.]|uniref:LamG domain-containing protein n=1 Tax=Aeoliella sp. TaxID=2795800 RepID=UPI003CCB80D0